MSGGEVRQQEQYEPSIIRQAGTRVREALSKFTRSPHETTLISLSAEQTREITASLQEDMAEKNQSYTSDETLGLLQEAAREMKIDPDKLGELMKKKKVAEEVNRRVEAKRDQLTWFTTTVNAVVENAKGEKVVARTRRLLSKKLGEVSAAVTGKRKEISHDDLGRLKSETINIYLGLQQVSDNLTGRKKELAKRMEDEQKGDKDENIIANYKRQIDELSLIEDTVMPLVFFQEVTQRKIQERALALKLAGKQGQVAVPQEVFANYGGINPVVADEDSNPVPLGEGVGPQLLDFKVGYFTVDAKGKLVENTTTIGNITTWGIGAKPSTEETTPGMEKAVKRPLSLEKLLKHTDGKNPIVDGMRLLFGKTDKEIDETVGPGASYGMQDVAKRVNRLISLYTAQQKVTIGDVVDENAPVDIEIMLKGIVAEALKGYSSSLVSYIEHMQQDRVWPAGYRGTQLKEVMRATNELNLELKAIARRSMDDKYKGELAGVETELLELYRTHSLGENLGMAAQEKAAVEYERQRQILTAKRERILEESRSFEEYIGMQEVVNEEKNLEAVWEARHTLFELRTLVDRYTVEHPGDLLHNEKLNSEIMRQIGVLVHNVPGVAEFIQIEEIMARYQELAYLTGWTEEKKDGKSVKKAGLIGEAEQRIYDIELRKELLRQKQAEIATLLQKLDSDPNPQIARFNQGKEQLTSIDIGLGLLVAGSRNRDTRRLFSLPLQQRLGILKEIEANGTQLEKLRAKGQQNTEAFKVLLTQRSELEGRIFAVEKTSSRLVNAQEWLGRTTVPEEKQLLAVLSGAKIRLSETQAETIADIYRTVTGKKVADPARMGQDDLIRIASELVSRRRGILTETEKISSRNRDLQHLSVLEGERAKLEVELGRHDVSGDPPPATPEFYARNYLDKLLARKKRLEELLLPQSTERKVKAYEMENGTLIEREVLVPAGESYLEMKRKEALKKLKKYEIDSRDEFSVRELAETIRVVTGMDAQGNFLKPGYIRADYLLSDDAPFSFVEERVASKLKAETVPEKRLRINEQMWQVTAQPNREFRLTFHFDQTLRLETVNSTHKDLVLFSPYVDLGMGDMWHNRATPHENVLWERLGIENRERISDIDLAGFGLNEIPYDQFRSKNDQGAWAEWIRYVDRACGVRGEIIELLSKPAITLDDVYKLDLESKVTWLRRNTKTGLDEKGDIADFYFELADYDEIYSAVNRRSWNTVRVLNDQTRPFYFDRIRIGAMADKLKHIYMKPIGVDFSMAALGGERGARPLMPQEKIREALHLAFSQDGLNLLAHSDFQNLPTMKSLTQSIYDRLVDHFNRFQSINGELLKDFLASYNQRRRFSTNREEQVIRDLTVTDLLVFSGLTVQGEAKKIVEIISRSIDPRTRGQIQVNPEKNLLGIETRRVTTGSPWTVIRPDDNLNNPIIDVAWQGDLIYDKELTSDDHLVRLESPIYRLYLEEIAQTEGWNAQQFREYLAGFTETAGKYVRNEKFNADLDSQLIEAFQQRLNEVRTVVTDTDVPFYAFGVDSYSWMHTFMNMATQGGATWEDHNWINLYNTDEAQLFDTSQALGALKESMQYAIVSDQNGKSTHLKNVKILSQDGDVCAKILHGNGYKSINVFNRFGMEITRTPCVTAGLVPWRLEFFGVEETMYRTKEWQLKGRGDIDQFTEHTWSAEQNFDFWHGLRNLWIVGEQSEHFKDRYARFGPLSNVWAKGAHIAKRFFFEVGSRDELGFIQAIDQKFKLGQYIPLVGQLVDILPINPIRSSTYLFWIGLFALNGGWGNFFPPGEAALGLGLINFGRMYLAKAVYGGLVSKIVTHKAMADLGTASRTLAESTPLRTATGAVIGAGVTLPFTIAGISALTAAALTPVGVAAGIGLVLGGIIGGFNLQKLFFVAHGSDPPEKIVEACQTRLMQQFGTI